jgi:hypothetical protein
VTVVKVLETIDIVVSVFQKPCSFLGSTGFAGNRKLIVEKKFSTHSFYREFPPFNNFTLQSEKGTVGTVFNRFCD